MKFLKKTLLASIIPAILLAVAGIYAIVQEAERSRDAEESFLETKADHAAELISSRVKDIASSVLSQVAEEVFEKKPDTLKSLVESNPFIRTGYLWYRRDDGGRGRMLWSSTESPREAFLSNEFKRRSEFTAGNTENISPSRECYWVSEPSNTGRRIACWRCVSTNLVCLVEIETMAVLARMSGWLEEFGVNAPKAPGRQGLVAEVRDVTKGVLCPSSLKLKGSYFGEASLRGIMLPEWSVKIGWSRGDEVVSGRVSRVVIGAGSLLLLCAGWFAISFMLLAKAAYHAQKESMEKTTFVDNVSHELKTPLTSIMLYTEMLQGGSLKTDIEKVRAFDVISSECSRLLRMVENLLDFSRLEKKRRKFRIEKIEVVGFISETVDMVKERFEDNGISFDVGSEIYAWGEPDAVRQILLNILDNAAKYASVYGSVEVDVLKIGERVEISVKDHGPGISRNSLKHVFKRFWREDDSLTSEISGNGLGLSIAHHLANGMGGNLRVVSEEGHGCIFTLELKGVCDGENSCS
jgi:signal transduction histidine kinase